jgi:hypothetical protein
MPFSDAVYDPETLAMMSRVLDDAWNELQSVNGTGTAAEMVRTTMATRIMAAVAKGEREPSKLKLLALHAVDARAFGAGPEI